MARQKIQEWSSEALEPKMTWAGGEECDDGSVVVQCPGPDEVAVHIDYGGRGPDTSGPAASIYLTASQAARLAERLQTAFWLAETLGASDG